MIPYDDLVAALTTWRARQGLPTGQLSGAAAAAAAAPPAPAPAPPAKAAPTKAPPAKAAAPKKSPSGARPAAVVVESTYEDSLDVDEGALLEEATLDSDFAMSFGSGETGESTAIGTPPSPPRRRGR